ncbi:MarR family winged helix-turn-helix transcriptional regulator [Falsiroseomonas tokyonensis]|uniref:MarR family winged helix-turn-helix transcriptional regulator n=1 Tax=Falsiroseomonas tokyonensis TaxID=430521 RepID=A0ABV7BTX6_9PROT|nr:MarR family transcriptional regulator [Falsiroseomonas tokyonensis]MBU8538659.1 MarR family transcriptional regulator [Falsiroseomonas tokyonensis]
MALPRRLPAEPRVEQTDLAPLDDKLGFWLRLAQQSGFDTLQRGLGPLGLTPGRLGVLLLVEANPDIRQALLAEALRIKPSNLTVLLAALEQEGLIRRDEEEGNRRANRLRLTEAGRALLRQGEEAEAAAERQLAARLRPADRAALLTALRRIAGG